MGLTRAFFVSAALLVGALRASSASEPGSGTYASDCKQESTHVAINIRSDGFADIRAGGKSYDKVLTSYSFFGDATPSDFLIAIMFAANASPLATVEGQPGWLEIWKKDSTFFALESGDKSNRLDLCGEPPQTTRTAPKTAPK